MGQRGHERSGLLNSTRHKDAHALSAGSREAGTVLWPERFSLLRRKDGGLGEGILPVYVQGDSFF